MDHDKEIYSLASETIAIQNILAQVLFRLSCLSPEIDAAIRKGFDDAASSVEDSAIIIGERASHNHLINAIKIVDQLREATFGDDHKPRHRV